MMYLPRVLRSVYYPETGSTTPPPAPPADGPACHGCGKPIGDSPSDWYCGQDCQATAMRAASYRPGEVLDRALSTAADAWLYGNGVPDGTE